MHSHRDKQIHMHTHKNTSKYTCIQIDTNKYTCIRVNTHKYTSLHLNTCPYIITADENMNKKIHTYIHKHHYKIVIQNYMVNTFKMAFFKEKI